MLGFNFRNGSNTFDNSNDSFQNEDKAKNRSAKGQYTWENIVTLSILCGLSGVYIYLLLSPDQPTPLGKPRPCVIPADTKIRFEDFLKAYNREYSYLHETFSDVWTSEESSQKDWASKRDDFFYTGQSQEEIKETELEPIVPSSNYLCESLGR